MPTHMTDNAILEALAGRDERVAVETARRIWQEIRDLALERLTSLGAKPVPPKFGFKADGVTPKKTPGRQRKAKPKAKTPAPANGVEFVAAN